MAGTSASNTSTNNSLNLGTLKDAGRTSVVIGISAAVTLFAVQAALVAGKALVSDVKSVAGSIKA